MKLKAPKQKWIRLLTTTVAGLPYYGYDENKLAPHQSVRLVHERNNEFSSNAIRVEVKYNRAIEKYTKLGYIKTVETTPLHEAKARGCKFRAFITQHFKSNPHWNRVFIAIDITGGNESEVRL